MIANGTKVRIKKLNQIAIVMSRYGDGSPGTVYDCHWTNSENQLCGSWYESQDLEVLIEPKKTVMIARGSVVRIKETNQRARILAIDPDIHRDGYETIYCCKCEDNTVGWFKESELLVKEVKSLKTVMSPREFADKLIEALGLTKDMQITAIDIHVDCCGNLPKIMITRLADQKIVDLMKDQNVKIKLGDTVVISEELAFGDEE